MQNGQPTMTYTGTVDEVFRHRDEIPAGAMLELKVFVSAANDTTNPDNGDTRTLFDRYSHLFGTEHGLPPDLSERAEQYLIDSGFGVTRDPRKLEK